MFVRTIYFMLNGVHLMTRISILCMYYVSAYLMFNYLDIRCFKVMLDVGSKTKTQNNSYLVFIFLGTSN